MTRNGAQPLTPRPVPVTPSLERWQAMTAAEREQFIVSVNDALSDPVITMSEGRPHKKAKSHALDMLGLHFRTMGKHVYLAEELSVLYPNTAGFTPDVMAVLDVEEPEDDQRMAWVVADEGKGLDWVLEVLWAGDRKKDLEENVIKYAALGIPEYFIYDQKLQRLLGYRLPVGGKAYRPILAQAGLYHSNVLGIDLAIVEKSLRIYQGSSELYDTKHLIKRLEGIVANLQERAEQAQRDAEQAQHNAEQAQRDAEQAQRDAEQARTRVRKNIAVLLGSRGISLSTVAQHRLEACTNFDRLDEWFMRALQAKSEADVFGSDEG